MIKYYRLHLEEEDIIFYQCNWQRGRYVYNLSAWNFAFTTIFIQNSCVAHSGYIYQILVARFYFHANNFKEMLKLINLELEIMPSNIVVEENYCWWIHYYTNLAWEGIQKVSIMTITYLWRKMGTTPWKIKEICSHVKVCTSSMFALNMYMSVLFQLVGLWLCLILLEYNSNFIGKLTLPKEIIYLVCFVIAAKL